MKSTRLIQSLPIFLLTSLGSALAQDTPPDLEARKASVANLEQHIAQREDRLAELAEDILRLDARVEKRIDAIVKTLAESKDSEESTIRVATTKLEAIEGLRNAIEFYDKKRRELKESLRQGNTDVARDVLEEDVKKFDDRIEKRVEQILELTNSFTQHKDYPKYIETPREDYFGLGWSDTEIRINEKWKLNHRETIKTDAQRKKVMEALAKNIEDLEKRQSYLKAKLDQGFTTDAEKDLYALDYQRVRETINVRKQQLADFEEGPATQADTTPVSKDLAYSMYTGLEDSRKDLRADILEIFRLYDELNRERGRLEKMRANLEARKAWLKEHGAE